jgi:hypothetical protein
MLSTWIHRLATAGTPRPPNTNSKVPWSVSLLVLMGRRGYRVSGTVPAESGFQIAVRYGFAADEAWALGC